MEKLNFVNVDNSEAINQYMRQQCSWLIDKMDAHPGRFKFDMKVRAEARTPEGQVKSYQVMGEIRIAGSKILKVRKKNKDIKKAIDEATQSLEKQMRRLSRKKVRSRTTVGKTLKPVREYKLQLTMN